jgi:hypothetical protein
MLYDFGGMYPTATYQPIEYTTYRRFYAGLQSNLKKLKKVMPYFLSECSTSQQWLAASSTGALRELEAYERRTAATNNPEQRRRARPSQTSNPLQAATPRPSQSQEYLRPRSRDAQYEGGLGFTDLDFH